MALILEKHKMPVQDPKVRAHNFDEVALGYDEETAVAEAERCLHCKVPQCRKGCPVSIDIPAFIGKIKERDFDGAIATIKESNALPAICGRVCPQENQCEKHCILAKRGESAASNASWLTASLPRTRRSSRSSAQPMRKKSLSSALVRPVSRVPVIWRRKAMM